MTAISNPLKAQPDRPVDPLALAVIAEIQQAAETLGVPVFVVGAAARIILLENVHGLDAGRATTDVDIAFAVDHWTQFEQLKAAMLANARFRASEKLVHRLYFQSVESAHAYQVDLIPFGGIETSPDTITWPPDMAIMMNVAGLSGHWRQTVTEAHVRSPRACG